MDDLRLLLACWIVGVAARLVIALGVAATEPSTPSPENAELFNLVATRHDANLGQIRTWRGRVRVVTETCPTSAETSGSSRREEASITFVLDRTSGARRSNYAATKCVEIVDGVEKEAPIREVGIMVKDQAHYEYMRYPPQSNLVLDVVDPTSPTGSKRVQVGTGDIKRMAIIHSTATAPPSRGREDHFDPLEHLTCQGKDVAERFRVFYGPAKNGEELPGVTIGREGELVTLKLESSGLMNRYTVDLGKGGCLVAFDASEEPAGPRRKWRCDLQCVAGVWIPKRTTFERTSRGIKFVRRLEWIENAINEPIPEDEFSLVKLGVRRGDTVEDTRTGVSYIVTGSEYPPADDGTAAEELKVASTRRIVLIAAGVLLLALLAFLAWTYSRKPKVTEA